MQVVLIELAMNPRTLSNRTRDRSVRTIKPTICRCPGGSTESPRIGPRDLDRDRVPRRGVAAALLGSTELPVRLPELAS